ncbi:hypothetical protein SAMN04489761_4608 [Tenacibaculum sp. MAR_2009_124]|uniref:hypothetical protein n=1 Tax=Tenacibaculum sp. MAR_2009_124 TaxID=1250059 RepID=UPI0008998332|nr:hypothetical protein [Tenacibaculum sp. MAR_2009_124]SED20327.1 hypothetical protein SAMN04489761_4608 [Tenacibaculum sp. MAR_2009_124]
MKEQNFITRLFNAIRNFFRGDCDCDECIENGADKGIFCYKDEGRTKEMLAYPEVIEMLKRYDGTRIEPFEQAYGYEDTRMNTFNFYQFKKYLGHIENLSKRAGIRISGISFIYGAKNHEGARHGYNSLVYLPSTVINGKEVLFDPVQSARQGKLVTFKEMLERYGYQWIYDDAEDYEQGKRKDNNYDLKSNQEKSSEFKMISNDDFDQEDESGTGNHSTLAPPYH